MKLGVAQDGDRRPAGRIGTEKRAGRCVGRKDPVVGGKAQAGPGRGFQEVGGEA